MEDYNNSSYYSANPETLSYLNTNSSNFETTTNEMEQQNPPPSSSNMVSKSKYGWVEVIGNDSNVYVFSRAIVNDLTGKFELFQDETMRLVIFTVILGHPKILVAIIKDVVYLRSLTESCAFKCDSVEEAQSWGKFLCYPMFSPVPITKSSECDWLYENNNSSRGGGGGGGASLSSLTPLEEQELFMNNNTPRGGAAAGGGKQTELLHHLARQQIQFKIAEMTRKQKLKQAEKKKIKIQQLKKSRHQQVLKQRAERIENNPNMKRKLNSYRHRYDNISEIFRHHGGAGGGGGGAAGTKPLPPPPVLTSGQRELELSKQKRLARQNYENTLQILIENREQILKNEMEIMKFKLQEERQHQHEYSEQKLLEELLSHTKNGQLMTPTKQFEQMCSIVKIQALWRGATTRNYLENKRALMEIQEEILSTIESAQKFQTIFHNDSVYGGGDVGGCVGGGSDVGDGENENEIRRSGAPPLSASVGTLTSQAMKSLKELGYDIPSYFYSPSKPHERGGSFQSSQSFRKGVTYYDPNEHQNFMNNTQQQHHQQQQQQSQQQQQQSSPPSNSSNYPTMQPRPPNKSSSPSKYSQTLHNPYTSTNHPTTSQHQQTQPYNFSKTSPSSSYHLNYSSNKSDHLTSPTSDTRRVVNKSPYPSNSTVSMSTYDHSSINPNGWSGYEMSNERNSNSDPQQQHHHPHHPHHHQTHHTSPPTMISESQRLKLLTPVAENKSVKSNDSFNSPNYYLDRHYETSGLYASGTQQQFASTSTVLSDLTDHDFGEGKGGGGGGSGGVIYTVEVDVSTPSSHSSQSFPQISPNQGNEQDGDGKKTNPPSNSNKPTRNSILLPQKVITNQSTEANQTSSRSSSTSPRNNSILAPSSNQRQPSDNGPNQSQSQSQSHAQGQDQGQGQGQSQPQPQLQPQQQPPAQAPPNTTTNNNNVPSQRKSIVASSQSQSQNNSPIIDTPTVTSTSRKSFITPQAPQVEKITSQSTVNSTTPSNQRKSILTPQVQPNPYPYFQDQAVTTIINNPSSRKSILSPQPPKGQNELELKPNGQETRQGVGSESLPSSRTEIPSNPSNLSNLSNQRTGENNANTNGISNINPDALTYMNTRMNSQQTVGNLSNNESSDTTDKQNLDSSSNSRPNTLKKSQSVKSTGSSRSSVSKKSQGFGVYFGTELVAQASSLEEIPILMDKIANDRMEEANRQKEAEVTTQGADVQSSSLPIQNQVQSPTPTAAANSTVTVTATDLQTSSSPSPPPQAVVETPPPMENTENTPTGNEKKVEEGDNNSVASSKTAFEVWVGGKLVGIAKDKDELPIIVAAAKAQEKLKRKLVSSRSKKSIKSTGKSESKRRLQGSESSSTVLDSEQTPGEDGNGELNTESNEQNE